MRPVRLIICFFLLSVATFADDPKTNDLKIKVIDPQSAAIAGAQVELVPLGRSAPPAERTTSGEGIADFPMSPGSTFRIRVLAPGFAVQSEDMPKAQSGIFTVQLHLATAADTVVVTATRTPAASDDSGAAVETLSGGQLATMRPVAANDALRFLPGAVLNSAGQRGGLSSLFVRGGDSTYNKVIVDGVTVNEPGGTFDFGTLRLQEADRLEFLRGAQSTLYGSDAMTSVVQVWTRSGTATVPELRFGADGGNFGTAHGYLSLSGDRGSFDYNLFGDQFNTSGQGVNDSYSDSLQGANLGVALTNRISLRVRGRHSNSHTGLPGEWNFNGNALQPPDSSDWSQLNTMLGSAELNIQGPSGWQHRLTGFDYSYRYTEVNLTGDSRRIFDFPSHEIDHINRGGFEYQGDYSERAWAHTTVGYRFEDENGFVGNIVYSPQTHGQRLNHDVYGLQQLTLGRLSVVAGARFGHNSAFGNTGVPRIALTLQALRGGEVFSGTRLRFSYATGFKEPRLEETFAGPPYTMANPELKPERNRAFEAAFVQNFVANKYVFSATYFNNLFHDKIDYSVDPMTFIGRYVNVDQSFAQGAELELQGKIRPRLLLNSSYTYTSTQILQAPLCTPANFCDPILSTGRPLLRRPKHSASVLLTYLGTRWGANLGGSFVGRRPDSDFLGFNFDYTPGYVRVDMGGWYAINSRVTAYANIENALNKQYQEVVGFPALGVNFRVGMRFRIGGD
ncbi:MAG: TonB-dependent receptor [Terriglobales bacterium]